MTINVTWLQNGGYTAQQDRTEQTAMLTKAAVVTVRNGIFPSDGTDAAVTAQGTPNMTVNVSPFQAVVADASGRAYIYTSDSSVVSPAFATASGSNPRIDLLIARVYDNAAGDSAATTSLTLPGSAGSITVQSVTGTIETVTGTPGSGTAPAVPNARCIILAVVTVRTSATSVITGDIAASGGSAARVNYTVAAGGVLPCSSSSTYPASPYVGMTLYDITRDCLVKWNGTAWTTPGPLGMLAVANSPGHTGITTATVLASVTPTLISGRKYKVTAYAQCTQNTSTGTVNVQLSGTSGVPTNFLYLASTAATFTAYGSTSAEFTAPSSGGFSFQVVGSTSAGTLTDSTATQIFVEDIGN